MQKGVKLGCLMFEQFQTCEIKVNFTISNKCFGENISLFLFSFSSIKTTFLHEAFSVSISSELCQCHEKVADFRSRARGFSSVRDHFHRILRCTHTPYSLYHAL